MSKSIFTTTFILLCLVLCISCFITDRFHANLLDEDYELPQVVYPKGGFYFRPQRSSFDHYRQNRNSWFRVSSYQHLKPNSVSEEKNSGDNLMRWG